MSDYASLQTLLALHRHGSLTAASRAMNSPKSTLSRRLAMLEAHLGYRLTRQEHGKLLLTEAGKHYLEYSEKIVALFDEGQRALHTLACDTKENVHVRLCPELPPLWAARVFSNFLSLYPDIRLDLRAIAPSGIVSDTKDDLWLGCSEETRIDGLDHIALGEWSRRLYVSADNAMLRDSVRHIGSLTDLQWISRFGEADHVELQHTANGECYRFQPASRLRVESVFMQADAIAGSNGIGILPAWLAECPKHGLKDKFIQLLPQWQAPPMKLSLFLRRNNPSKRLRILVDYLQEQLPPRWRNAPQTMDRTGTAYLPATNQNQGIVASALRP